MRKRNLMIAIAVAAAIAAVIVALSGGGGNSHHSGRKGATSAAAGGSELAIAAGYLGVPRAQLRRELRSGESLAQVAGATPGKSATGLIDALVSARAKQLTAAAGTAAAKPTAPTPSKTKLARLRRRVKAQVNRVRGNVGLVGTARYLGISTARLHAELETGHSLAQIAGGIAGKSAAGLIAARVSAREAVLKAARASGRISQKTEQTLLSSLRQRVEAEVARTPSR